MRASSAWCHHRAGTEPPPRARSTQRSSGGAVVTDEYVRCIRAAHAVGRTQKELQAMFPKLKVSAIRAIALRESWKHVR